MSPPLPGLVATSQTNRPLPSSVCWISGVVSFQLWLFCPSRIRTLIGSADVAVDEQSIPHKQTKAKAWETIREREKKAMSGVSSGWAGAGGSRREWRFRDESPYSRLLLKARESRGKRITGPKAADRHSREQGKLLPNLGVTR